jgi:actin-related protein
MDTQSIEKHKRPPSSWMKALKEFNASKGGSWSIPKKGSEEYLEVKKIQNSYTKQPTPEKVSEVKTAPKRTKKTKPQSEAQSEAQSK